MEQENDPKADTAKSLLEALKKQSDFLRWDRDINGKLYYALWILFMSGFTLSLTYGDKLSNCACVLSALYMLRTCAIFGSALNFVHQDKAIEGVQLSFKLALKYEEHISHYYAKESEKAMIAHKEANDLNDRLIRIGAVNSAIGIALKIAGALFLLDALYLSFCIKLA